MLKNWLKSTRGEEGFTLIEMSIVLVIIGLLIGGVLKGQELIASTRLKALVSQWDSYKAALGSFQDRYQNLPGDFAGAVTDIRANSVEIGNGNGIIDAVDAAPFATIHNATEALNFWAHLAAANMISGVTLSGGAAAQPAATGGVPASRFAGSFWAALTGTANGVTTVFARHQAGTIAAAGSLHGGQYAEIERKYDDSRGNSGQIMESGAATCTTAAGVLAPLARANDCIILFQLQ
jgi:prepilin-type N-terminal cleavage/methylation domain-containing protein